MRIAKNCSSWILIPFIFGIISIAFIFFHSALVAIPIAFFSLSSFFLFFFRDPDKEIGNGIVSPADGKILSIRESNSKIISIFMNIYDVHVNRAPLDGIIKEMKYIEGRHFPAFTKSSEKNERLITIMDTEIGLIKIVQVAGSIARRIVPYIKEGQSVKKGDKIGIIRFGSRVDLYLPKEIKLKIKAGEKLKAGESIGTK